MSKGGEERSHRNEGLKKRRWEVFKRGGRENENNTGGGERGESERGVSIRMTDRKSLFSNERRKTVIETSKQNLNNGVKKRLGKRKMKEEVKLNGKKTRQAGEEGVFFSASGREFPSRCFHVNL